MKKRKILLFALFLIMFIPLMVNAETCDTDKVSISSLTIENKSENVTELDNTTASGKNINLNLSMSEVGDSIEYKAVVKNDSNEDYELDNMNYNTETDYFNYNVSSDDESNIIKANSIKTVNIKVEYKNEVPNESFVNGAFSDTQTMTVQLSPINTSSIQNIIENPNTLVQSYILIFLIILVISIIAYILLKNKKYKTMMLIILGLSIIIPISIHAICKCEVTIDFNVKLTKNYPLAKDLLIINPSGETKSEKSPYVIYPSQKGNILCRVLYDKDSEYGIQIVTDNPVDKVTLGTNDPSPNVSGTGNERAGNSYNRAITTLNEKAMEYKDSTGIAKDARSIGSIPDDKNYPDYLTGTDRTNLYWKHEADFYEYYSVSYFHNKYFNYDSNSTSDVNALQAIDAAVFDDLTYGEDYWLASRSKYEFWGVTAPSNRHFVARLDFKIISIDNQGNTNYNIILGNKQGTSYYENLTKALRPVFTLNDDVVIIGGDGTKESPYILSIW